MKLSYVVRAGLGALLGCAITTGQAADSVFDGTKAAPGAASMEFSAFRDAIPNGEKFGDVSYGLFCTNTRDLRHTDRVVPVWKEETQQAFRQEGAGGPITMFRRDESAFDSASPQDPDFKLGATIIGAKFENYCIRDVSAHRGVKGNVAFTVKWELFSTRSQQVVYSKTVSGSAGSDSFEEISEREYEIRSLGVALKQVFADEGFRKAVAAGAAESTAAVKTSPLALAAGPAVKGGAQKNVEGLRSSVVTLESGRGSGSGFFIDATGYIVTNQHVVGDAKFVRVRLSSGQALVGEVLRADAHFDVALVKTDPPPVAALHLRAAVPAIGEDVFAIGAPRPKGALPADVLAGTFTRGILSGVREFKDRRVLQSDVAVNPGNSGGPLVDTNGDVVGIAAAKIQDFEGVGFFIPIQDALQKLSVRVE